MDKKTFTYGGHTFCGVRTFTENEDFRTISKELWSVVGLKEVLWSHDEFYRLAEECDGTDYDIFLMDGRFQVVPCQNDLFIWGRQTDEDYNRIIRYRELFDGCSATIKSTTDNYFRYIAQLLGYNSIITFAKKDRVSVVLHTGDNIVREPVISVQSVAGTVTVSTADATYDIRTVIYGLDDLSALLLKSV